MAWTRCWRSYISRTSRGFVILHAFVSLGFILLLCIPPTVEGVCIQDGFHYANNTVWESEPCTLCSCLGDIVSCHHKQCFNPQCDFQRGDRLKIAANRCCPECGTSSGSCLYEGEVIGHNSQWRPEPCIECYCRAGTVHCSNTSCPTATQCSAGEILQRIAGQCCPECMRPGRTCTYRGITYHHSQEWNPVKCAKCICNNGVVNCFVVDCPPVTCQQGQEAVVPEGKCCPECVGSSCQVDSQIYPDGVSWRLDRCTYCQCNSGSVSCTQESCADDLPCAGDERRITRPGQCCSECVKLEAPCDADGTRWYSGDLWNVSECEFCMCHRGRVECHTAECDRVECRTGETLIQREGRCCPECAGPTGLCYFEEDTYQDGQSWQVNSCSICSCDVGEVNCYVTDCPPCPVGTVPIEDEGRCCPECVTVQCPPECLSCDDAGCTSCRHGHLLQDGRCIDGCSVGFYQSSDLRCQSCHQSCASCSAGTEYHCLTCQPGLLLKWGQCVEECGPGFFASQSTCSECHSSCQFCSGPRQVDCTSCANSTNVIKDSRCVDECGNGFYLRDSHCHACDPSCRACYPDSPFCTSCRGRQVLQEGKCVPHCSPGFFSASQYHCEVCHPSCQECRAAGINSCVSCAQGHYLQGSRCLSNCTLGFFNVRSECIGCHSSCRTCVGPTANDCSSCRSPTQIVQGRPPFYDVVHGSCTSGCREGFYASTYGTCLACNPTCLTCSSSEIDGCNSCRPPLLLLSGFCVRQCSDGQFNQRGICVECHPSCNTCDGPGEDQCTACYASDALLNGRCTPACPNAKYPTPLGYCEDCSSGCSTCFALHQNAGSTCTQCYDGLGFPLGDGCVEQCSVGFYQDYTGMCKECHSSCRSCGGGGVYDCTSCRGGHVLNNLGQCSLACFGGYYNDGGICKSCSSDCLECASPVECHVCRNPSDVLQFGECSPGCADQYFLEPLTRLCRECDWSCNSCDGPSASDCVECMEGMILRDGTCVNLCGTGYYQTRGVCKECGSNCATCSSQFSCTSCQYPYYLLGEYCVQACDPGYYAEPTSRVCIHCPPNCIECETSDSCQTCTQGTYLSREGCVSDCGRNAYPNTEAGQCDANIHPPTLVVNGTIRTEIGGTRVLDPSFFTAYDTDTSNYDLYFVVVSPPNNGQLIKINRGRDFLLRVRDTFSYEDLLMGSVRYVHNAKKALSGFVSILVSDRQLESPPIDVGITIVSPFAPTITRNEPLVVEEGDIAQITPALNLQIHDEDNPLAVVVTVVESPNHGRLIRLPERDRVREFDLDALERGSIHYAHDGTETRFDIALLQVTDGYNIINIIFNIHILPKDNSGPILVNNIQAQVQEGQRTPITSQLLKAKDIDSEDSLLVYTLTPPANNPQRGEVLMIVPIPESGLEDGWEDIGNGFMKRQMYRFRQGDLDQGRIFYQSSGTETSSDYFMFEVSDEGNPPNVLSDQMFNIAIMPENDEPPRLLPGIPEPLGILVREGEVTTVSANLLTFTDQDSVVSSITYNITVPLQTNEGSIEHADYPHVAIWQFTQADISAGKIVYRPPTDIGSRSATFIFQFMVTDVYPDGNTVGPFPFNITILPIDNLSPTFRNSAPLLQVERGGHLPIRTTVADVVDLDTPVSRLVYTLVKAPQHGYLRRGAYDYLEVDDTFTRQELVENSFHYVHDGSSASEDNFVIRVSDGQQHSSLTATISVLFVDEASPLVGGSTSMSMSVAEHGNKTLTSEIISFHDDASSPRDIEIRLISAPNFGKLQRRLPNGKYGTLERGSTFTQFDVDNYDVRYMATGEIGKQPENEILLLNITDSNGNTLPNQVFSIAITPVNNERPVVSVANNFQIDEGARGNLNTIHIRASDVDTYVSDLSVIVSVPPSFGFLENIAPVRGSERSGAGEPIATFSIQDLIDGNIYYVQSGHVGMEPVADGFLFHVTDGVNNSPPQIFNITILLLNDEEPTMFVEQLLVEEGQGALIANVTLYASDLDTPNDELTFEVVVPPSHGTLRRLAFREDAMFTGRILGAGDTFSYEDVLNELLVYIHDGSDTPSDSITIELDDGRYRARETMQIRVGLVSDETPRVTVNRGLNVQAGSSTPITADEFVVTDIDSSDEGLVITLATDVTIGSLRYVRGDRSEVIGTAERRSSFTQGDINNGYIEYVHEIAEGAGTTIFKFSVEDPEGNRLIDESFIITIVEDRIPPRILANRPLIVDEGGFTVMSTNCLSATDVDSVPGNLLYTISSGPSEGHIEMTGHPGVPISEFTQADLAARSLQYVHTSRGENPMDSFIFTVSDGTNDVTQTFYINISPVDDSLPLLTNYGVRVQEGVRKTITEFELKAQDADTPEGIVQFTILQPPVHGTIDYLNDDGRYTPTVSFTMTDVYENRISYNHDGSNTVADDFEFTVSDGRNAMFTIEEGGELVTTNTPQTFSITIMPVDDGTPRIVTNLGLGYLDYSDDRALGVITDRNLQTMDTDTEDRQLLYTVTSPPRHGYLESPLEVGTPITVFTQEDINNGLVRYILDTDSVDMVTSDRFVFDVSDTAPNIVSGTVFRIRWALIHFEKAVYNVSEQQGSIGVTVKRTGNLNQYSIVLCRTEPGTATSASSISARPGLNDYVEHAGQVQFEEREDTKVCTIIINDDTIYEDDEEFIVALDTPAYALLGDPFTAVVAINDIEDKPTILFEESLIHVNESSGFVFAPLIRTGDVSKTVTVICFTIPGSATSSSLSTLESGSDYKARGMDIDYQVVFPAGVRKASCDVKLIDDALYEEAEDFQVSLAMPSFQARLGETSRATVIIDGPNDESLIYLPHHEYIFNENAGTVEIEVIRQGSDLTHTSMVWCSPKALDPPSANPGEDFIPSSSQLTFRPQQTVEVCRISIVDDVASPRMEGNETFIVFLSSAMGSALSAPHEALVVINDTSDIPTMQFSTLKVTVEEQLGVVHVPISRTGDLSYESSVVCYTRQKSAQVMMDYDERRDTDESRIVFLPGERTKNCTVGLMEDGTYEPDEQFLVKLSHARGNAFCKASIGTNNTALVTITDREDAPMLQFERMAYSVREPSRPDQTHFVAVTIVRTGDRNRTSQVRLSTRDGSAKSGVDYEPYSNILNLEPGVESIDAEVEILYNEDREWHETFSVVLGPDEPINALLGPFSVATVTIIDEQAAGSIVLPTTPIVVSLMDFDDVSNSMESDPSPGYPLVCIIPCDPQYPDYSMTGTICEQAGINASNIRYSWEVAMPTDAEGSRAPFERIVDDTPYTSAHHKVLESVYFSRRFHIRCVAQPYDKYGRPGVPLRSNIVTIGTNNGICHTPVTTGVSRGLQAQSFIANLAYLDPTDEEHPNTLRVSVEIPHQDGMLPLISTLRIHNIRLLLTQPVYRQQHICSNLINDQQRGGLEDYTFLDDIDYSNIFLGPGHDYPYQFDSDLREEKALRLYKHLNLKSCTWTFETYYHMTELIDLCGGAVTTDFQVRGDDKSFLTVTLPLYISYVYVTAPTGWATLDHRTEMEFSFFYQTILWRAGLETDSVLSGRLQVLRIRIGENGNMIIDFKTTTKFRGMFVPAHHTLAAYESRVVPPAELGVGFDLELLWTEGTYDSPQQLWRATSDYNLKDYSGDYIIELLPCSVTTTQAYNMAQDGPPVCTAHTPEKFVVPIAFQQTNRPVPVVYSLNTEFHLMNNEKVFLMNPNEASISLQDMDYQGAFSKGQTIFGRVLWNPDQDLDQAYKLSIEKLYICTGKDGYSPYYDPSGSLYNQGPQFGCMQDTENLKSRFLILDRGNPDAVQESYNDVPFEAHFASSSPQYSVVSEMPGVDGFAMQVDPLYKVNSGHQWYMQVIYTIGPSDSPSRFRRSLMSPIQKRQAFGAGINGVSKNSQHNGTNMHKVILQVDQLGPSTGKQVPESNSSMTAIVSAVVGSCLAVMVILVFVVLRKRKRTREREPSAVTETKPVPLNSMRVSAKPIQCSVEEVEMDLNKSVTVRSVNLNKPNNQGRQSHDQKVKKVSLEVKLKAKHRMSGTEV